MDNSTLALTVTRTETAPCCCEISIEIPPERVQKVYDSVVAKVSRQAKLPGFRAGKVPRAMLLSRYGKEIEAETIEQLMSTSHREMVKKEKLELAISPEVLDAEGLSLELGQPFTFKIKCEYIPEITLPEYKGLHLSREVVVVGDEQVDEYIDNWLQARQSFAKVERAAQQQDMLQVSYKAQLPESLEVPEKSKYLVEAENTWLVLREPEMLPGVMTALVGVSAGDEKDITLTFPADYREECLADKSLPYHFSIKEVHGRQVPELTEELAKEAGTEGIADLRAKVKSSIEGQEKRRGDMQLREQLVNTILSGLDFPLPPTVFRQEKESLLKQYYEQETRGGAKPEELREKSQEMAARAEGEAAARLRRHYVLDAIAKAEDIAVENREISSMVSYFARYEQVSPKIMVKRMQESGQIPSLIANLVENKTIDQLLSWADIAEVPAANAGKGQA
ncbi:MAG: trigger factor [Lentisphaerae bacterium]|nr:trigger factor [Lentisphaerota bacterium]